MKKILIALACFLMLQVSAQQSQWPIFKHYSQPNAERIALPVGGIGTGNISFAGNGQWKDVEIMNKPGVGFFGAENAKDAPVFLIFTDDKKGNKKTKALLGPIPSFEYAGMEGSAAPSHGFPRFAQSSFDAAYPFGTVNLSDEDMPISAKGKVFNPFVPGDATASGWPVAVIRYEITNKTNAPLDIAVSGSLENFIGMDGFKVNNETWNRALLPIGANDNKNYYKNSAGLRGIFMNSDSVDKDASTFGTIALTTTETSSDISFSYRAAMDPKGWNAKITDLWDDFSDDGIYRDTTYTGKSDRPRGAIAVKTTLKPGETRQLQFLLTWNFPNRKDWDDKKTVGNYYSTLFKDAWDVAEKFLPQLPSLETKTIDFVSTFLKSDYPDPIKEAALFNTSTLRSQTSFRTKDGNFFGWEGVFARTGSCEGNCTHVWNYEYTTPFLFGDLARSMRQTEYKYGLWDSTGMMSFRVKLPLEKNISWKLAAADGQMGTVMKVYREWQLSGDDAFLKDLWPGVKKALAFAWIPGGWDANKDGLIEGCQHNTMDIEYFGPNPEVEFWYLGALKAAAAMAKYLKDKDFETTCNKLFASGSRMTDEQLFNGEYYIQKIQPITDPPKIAAGTRSGMGSQGLAEPDFQIGDGCLVDQLVGQNMAFITGIGYLANPAHIKKSLESIAKYNYVKGFGNHFNNMRSYALGDEPGLMLTAYPDPAKRPKIPLSYAFEAWAGLEYTAATGMLYAGLTDASLRTVADVRKRYDGSKRSPFNEEECGNHYARSMAAWSTIIAWSDFFYSGVEKRFSMTSRPGNYFWSNGSAWGSAIVSDGKITIDVHHGTLTVQTVELKNAGSVKLKQPVTIKESNSQTFSLKK